MVARAVCRLKTINLNYTCLTAEQSTELLEASLSSTSLVEVDLWGADLSRVSSEVLARSVGRLQKVDISWIEMTANQCIAVGQAVLSSTSLRHADIRGILKHLPTQLINSLESKDYVRM